MKKFIYNNHGDPLGFISGKFIYNMHGDPIGQLNGSHAHKLSGQYVGELYEDMIVNMRVPNPGHIEHPGHPGNIGSPGHPGNRGAVNYGYEDVFLKLEE